MKRPRRKGSRICRPASLFTLLLFVSFLGYLQICTFHVNFASTITTGTFLQEKRRSGHSDKIASKSQPTQLKIRSTRDRTIGRNHTDVIVYLAQFGAHSSYGIQHDANLTTITGTSKLNKSLELLYTNYVGRFPLCDVLIFYEAGQPPDVDIIWELSLRRPQVQFRPLDGRYWELPHGLKPIDRFRWNRPAYSVGYRKMCRWFAILVWEYLEAEGYTHVMRMDDDSYLHSKINYNLFEYMRTNNKRYAFRMPVLEEAVGFGYDEIIDAFLKDNENATSPDLIDAFMKERYVGFYNNWFMAELSFFTTPPASMLLDLIDRTNIIFSQRTGDLVVHSTVVRLFLLPHQIQWFRDFTYEHMTLCRKERCGPWVGRGCPQNGGISRGIGAHSDEEWIAFSNRVSDSFADHPCPGGVSATNEFIGAEDIRYCSKIHSRCRFYMKMLLGLNNETA